MIVFRFRRLALKHSNAKRILKLFILNKYNGTISNLWKEKWSKCRAVAFGENKDVRLLE